MFQQFESRPPAIVSMKKVLPEKQKEVKPATDARIAAQKAVDDATAAIAKAPGGKADAALEKQLKDAIKGSSKLAKE